MKAKGWTLVACLIMIISATLLGVSAASENASKVKADSSSRIEEVERGWIGGTSYKVVRDSKTECEYIIGDTGSSFVPLKGTCNYE
jgi:hypothetical protein